MRPWSRRAFGQHPAADLAQLIDLYAYLTWSGVNSILRNSDTVDELFLYEVREDQNRPGRLRSMAWDYDEIMDDGESTVVDDPLISPAVRNPD